MWLETDVTVIITSINTSYMMNDRLKNGRAVVHGVVVNAKNVLSLYLIIHTQTLRLSVNTVRKHTPPKFDMCAKRLMMGI